MSSTGKKSLRKRKRQSPSHIGRRLEKLRCGQRILWDDVDDNEGNVQTKTKSSTEQTYIVLTDSEEERNSSRTRTKSRTKPSKLQDENLSLENDYKTTATKCPTCLICSVLTTLTSYNCCANHLDLLVHKKISHQQHSKQEISQEQWPPQQVMILPMTDELLQRYLSSQQIYQLKPKNSSATTNKKMTRKLTKKSTSTTSEISDIEPSAKPTQASPEPQIDSSLLNSGAIPADATFTVITSTSTTLNSFESPSMLDTCQLQQSSDQPIVIDDSQSDNSSTDKNKQKDPWIPISDETYEAIENALGEQTNKASQEHVIFPPAIARRTPTELMASRVPKIQLKQGRFRYGKPIADKNTSNTTATIENESRSNDISQSSAVSSSTSTSVMTTNTRPISALATIVEDESLVIPTTRPMPDKISQTNNPPLSERQDNTPEGLSDTIMSCLFAQDESSQQDNIQLAGKSLSNEALALHPPPVVNQIEESAQENNTNRAECASQSSQLTNDSSDTQTAISSTTNDKINTTPSRISYRRNPNGPLVSISRPRLSTNQQTPTSVLRQKSTDATSGTPHAR